TCPRPGVLGNSTDAGGDALTVALVNPPASGSVTLNADGSFVYTPNANFHGTEGFSYVVRDGPGKRKAAGVTIEVTAVNDLPAAVNDSFHTSEDVPLTVAAPGVLQNDTDADGDTMTAALVGGTANGSVSLAADGSFDYTPSANFNGGRSSQYPL